MKYTKKPLSCKEQIELLVSRNLSIPNKVQAEKILSRISYYRLSAYFLPFQKNKDIFNSGVSFDDIKNLYTFDHKFRMLIFEALKIIEIAVRTNITYHFSHKYGVFSYNEKNNFSEYFNGFELWFKKIEEEANRSNEDFVKHFKTKYTEEKHLPIWMITCTRSREGSDIC